MADDDQNLGALLHTLAALEQRVQELEGERRERVDQIESLEQQVQTLLSQRDPLIRPYSPVFLARDAEDAGSGMWLEQTVNDGEIEDYPGGRKSLVDGDASNLITELGDAYFVLEVPDGAAMRYVKWRAGGTDAEVLRVTGIASPAALGVGWYWATVQKRNDTAFNPAADLHMSDYYQEAGAGTDYVLILNDVENNAGVRTVPYASNPYLACWNSGTTADVGGTTYSVYYTKGVAIAC